MDLQKLLNVIFLDWKTPTKVDKVIQEIAAIEGIQDSERGVSPVDDRFWLASEEAAQAFDAGLYQKLILLDPSFTSRDGTELFGKIRTYFVTSNKNNISNLKKKFEDQFQDLLALYQTEGSVSPQDLDERRERAYLDFSKTVKELATLGGNDIVAQRLIDIVARKDMRELAPTAYSDYRLRFGGKDHPLPLEEAKRLIESPVTDAQMDAIEILKGNPATLHLLVKAMSNNADPEVQSKAAYALRGTTDPQAISALIEALKNNTDPKVRIEAAYALRGTTDPQAISALIEALKNNTDPKVRIEAAHVLRGTTDPQAIST
ncbi:MAG: HEAT repeat domain-containing protein, partial [Deltaproteobacteria bacterium]|nr:HEAT repeat domain-containing protein [Deltaproteobacteria bacterium]